MRDGRSDRLGVVIALPCSPDERSDIRGGVRVVRDVASLIRATKPNMSSRSRGAMRPEFCISFALQKSEGAGKTGCALHPRSRRRVAQNKCAHEHTGSAVNTPASPTQWLYGLYAIVLVTLLFVTPSLSGSVSRLRTRRLHRGVGPKRFRRTQVPRSSVAASRPPLPAPRLRRWPTPLVGGTG